MDSKPSPTQADPHQDGKVVVLGPQEWTDAEKALSKLAHVASDRSRPAAGFDFSAGPRVTEPVPDTTLRSADLNVSPVPTDRPAPGRGTSRGFTRLLMAACVGAAFTLTWQSYGGTAREMIASSVPQLGWLLLPPPAMSPPSGREIAVEQPSPPTMQAPAPQAASAQGGAAASTVSDPAASPAAPSLESQQLEMMARDLAAVRQSVEQLAAGQEQMAREIAKLQTAGQDIRRRISTLPPTPATTAHRPVPPPQFAPASSAAPLPTAPPQGAPQSSAAPPAPAQTATPSSALPPPPAASEPQLRPPMPVR